MDPRAPIPVDAAPGGNAQSTIKVEHKDYTLTDYNIPTGLGKFTAKYFPAWGVMAVRVKCKFTFKDGLKYGGTIDDGSPGGQAVMAPAPWLPDDAAKWKETFLAQTSTFWTLNHLFVCTKKGRESLRAMVSVKFEEATAQDSSLEVMNLQVFNGDTRNDVAARSCVRHNMGELGRADLDNMVARHEAGHMLGLGDEYFEAGKGPKVDHSSLVEKEFGYQVLRGDKGDEPSIMNKSVTGTKVLQEHGVIFLDALRTMTKEDKLTWAFGSFASPVDVTPEE